MSEYISEIDGIMAGEANRITLDTYDANVYDYIERSPQEVTGDLKQWIDSAFVDVPLDSSILEIGTGGGRDADYIETMGYVVQRTDASAGFVNRLSNKGYPIEQLNILTDNLDDKYDVVFADAVFLHFDPTQMEHATSKVFESLNENGKFVFSLKPGEGESWSSAKLGSPRYFYGWDHQGVEELLTDIGFNSWEVVPSEDGWLHYIAHKEPTDEN